MIRIHGHSHTLEGFISDVFHYQICNEQIGMRQCFRICREIETDALQGSFQIRIPFNSSLKHPVHL